MLEKIRYNTSMKRRNWLITLFFAVTIINYPNPFNPAAGQIATFECSSTATTEAFLYIYDMAARLLQRKVFNLQAGATNRITWNGYDANNELVGSSVYLYQLIDSGKTRLGKGKIWITNR
ncbi:hypothetical protein HZB07_04100 [Candidatus Saganbacteria bacterium]|nr:hypothetical protein [Candidatus Saganbacteria bacterium]